MGALTLVLTWFMFNAGSSETVDVTVPGNNVMSTIANTAMSASGGLVTTIILRLFETKFIEDEPLSKYDVVKTVNGLLSACVGITGVSNDTTLGNSFIIGSSSALIYILFSRQTSRITLDDPLEVTVIHGIAGFWGTICVGIFNKTNGLVTTGSSKQVTIQLYGSLALLTLSIVPFLIFFLILKKLYKLRVGEIFEILGQDVLDRHDLDIKRQIQNINKN